VTDIFPYFVREMVKLSEKARSDAAQQRKMVKDFAILGATSTPLVSGVLSLIEKGEFAPKASNPLRWMAARVAGGLMAGGLFPILRRRLTHPAPHRKAKS